MTATIRAVARPRGELTPEQVERLGQAKRLRDGADTAYRGAVVATLEAGASFAEVAKVTGLSTNTLQRWKRGAKR